MWDEFTYNALPMRVVFGSGTSVYVGDEVAHHGLNRVLVLATPGQTALANRISEAIGQRSAGVHAEARMHVPAETASAAGVIAEERGIDGCVAVGGGSAIGLGKALALRLRLPIIAIPTTYAGSEMTPVWGMTEDNVKRTGRDRSVLPRSVVYDPELTVALPTAVSVNSGFNALAHAVEALYAPDASPIPSLAAAEGVRALSAALPRIVAEGTDIDARRDALYGAWLCGTALANTTMSLHHKLCHVLGGAFDLPHAEVHTVLLPHVLAYNAAAAPAALDTLRQALHTDDPADALWELATELGAPRSLEEIGMAASDLDEAAQQVAAAPYANPRTPIAGELRQLLDLAFHGERPLPH